MLRKLKELMDYTVLASDAETIGQVHDFYFDDETWIIRYLVVETGSWLSGQKILISPAIIGRPGDEAHVLPVALTRNQIENSPPIDVGRPISRQEETRLADYYRWPGYWDDVSFFDAQAVGMSSATYLKILRAAETSRRRAREARRQEFTLHSADEVLGYSIKAVDGDVGHVADFLVDDQAWSMDYLVVDTSNWLPGRKVLLPLTRLELLDMDDSSVMVNLTQGSIKNSPAYDPEADLDEAYVDRLVEYYSRLAEEERAS